MAFNLAVFKTRTLTAIIFAAVMLAGLLWNHWSFFILFSIIHFGCWVEYQKLVGLIDPGYKNISVVHKYGVMTAGWGLMWAFSRNVFGMYSISWWWLLIFIPLILVMDWLVKKQVQLKNISHSIFGVIYISLSWALMMCLYDAELYLSNDNIPFAKEPFSILHFDNTWFLPVLVIACMWINDTMAYIVGSLIGKTPLSKISPKKTWEGTMGGVILCVALVGLILSSDWMAQYEPVLLRINHIHWYIIAAIAAITGTIGDLLESKLKRLAGVKDSGKLMPGHGGFLDRFDSLLVATPFVWLYVILFLR